MFVKPAPGREVRWPGTMRLLSDQGENVPDDFFWNRLLLNGDVVIKDLPVNILSTQELSKKEKEGNKDG